MEFEWILHYRKETPAEIEMTISEMERELIRTLEFEKGYNVTIEPFRDVRML